MKSKICHQYMGPDKPTYLDLPVFYLTGDQQFLEYTELRHQVVTSICRGLPMNRVQVKIQLLLFVGLSADCEIQP